MKKDRKLNRISRKNDRQTICDKIRTEAPVGMNAEIIVHADNTKSLILKDDHKVAFAYVEMQDNVSTITAVQGEPFFFKARNRNISRYLETALNASDNITGNPKINLIKLKPHARMNSGFATTLKNTVIQVNNTKINKYADQLIKQASSIVPA